MNTFSSDTVTTTGTKAGRSGLGRTQNLLVLLFVLVSCQSPPPLYPPVVVRANPHQGPVKAKAIRGNTAIKLADGLTMNLWASDSLAPDPIAMSIDDQGRVYLTRTNRQKNSEFDIRGHINWMTPSIGFQSVQDRKTFLRETFDPEKSTDNDWLEDLNQDGVHDWRDLTVEQDEVWRLEDENGDGFADVSTRILSDFNDEVTDVAGALLIRERDAFVGIGPDMWRLTDQDRDGSWDKKESISRGYAVHIGFSGHGMSGVIEGPDGRIYWGIGDIGANINAPDGLVHKYPNQGIIVRSNPDGSDFEVFAAGLRNTHEFVFDEYGNLIAADNDGDYPGESERLLYVVEGSDAGWRANWQYGKYTDPLNNKYNVWIDEEMFKPRWEGQAAYFIPPLTNYHNGPTGMVYNPGTALGSAWKNKFFLVQFVGNPSRSHLWAFSLKLNGASFELEEEIDVVSGILPTGIRFGPDGALYVADWVNGWGTKNYGRVWRLDVDEETNDWKEARKETNRLMQLDYGYQSEQTLSGLLEYPDMRIRLKSQFELVRRGQRGHTVFSEAVIRSVDQLARIHGIWGIGQLAREDESYVTALVSLLTDSDPEVVAQATKTLGDVEYPEAGASLVPLLKHPAPRVRFFVAQALGRIKYQAAVGPILNMLEANNDQDLYLRHAGVLALARIGQEEPVTALVGHDLRAMRIAAVMVLRRMASDKVAMFLQDADEYIVAEAARAINDDWSITAGLPGLASLLGETRFSSEPLLRRAINANLRVGGEKALEVLIDFANRKEAPEAMRAEALATLATWANPSVLDRVDGRYRGPMERDQVLARNKLQAHVKSLLHAESDEMLRATAKMIGQLKLEGHNDELIRMIKEHENGEVRLEMILALHQLEYPEIESVIKLGMEDRDGAVRTTALGLFDEMDIAKEQLPEMIKPILERGSVSEQQKLVQALGKMPLDKSEDILDRLTDQMIAEKLPLGLNLDLMEAIDSSKSERLIAKLNPYRSSRTGLDEYQEALYGGDTRLGQRYFFSNPSGQCTRCHSIQDGGGTVGPPLALIADELTREQLLEALVEPNARLAPGYGMVTVTLNDGQVITGTLEQETEHLLILKTSSAEPMEIPLSRIDNRQIIGSAMPAMGTLMSKKELRDLIEFLASLRAPEPTVEEKGP